jgi:hypothetical protein
LSVSDSIYHNHAKNEHPASKELMSNDGKSANSKGKKEKNGHPFLLGCLIGLTIGVILGWWFRPPESFPIEELRKATEKKFIEGKEGAREELADFAEELARKLREGKKK